MARELIELEDGRQFYVEPADEDVEENATETAEDQPTEAAGDFEAVMDQLTGYEPEQSQEPNDEPRPPAWLGDGEGWDPKLVKDFQAKAAATREQIMNAPTLSIAEGAETPPYLVDLSKFDDLVYTQSDLAGFSTEALEQKLAAKRQQFEDADEGYEAARSGVKRERLAKLRTDLKKAQVFLEWELKQRADAANFEKMQAEVAAKQQAERERAEAEAQQLVEINDARQKIGLAPLPSLKEVAK